MSKARDKANIPSLNFSSTGIDDNATSTAITIDSSGNVGIGTTAPVDYYADNLVINAQSEGGITLIGTSAHENYLAWADGTSGTERYSGYLSYNHSSNFMRFATNGGSERMRITSSGNVGIGTSSPSEKLVVERSGAGNVVRFTDGTYGVDVAVTSTGGSLQTGNINQTLDFKVYGNGYMGFYTSGTSERMRILSGGNVGIGTTTPDSLLSVNGVASFGDGTAAAPSITNFGDLDTGMFFPAANQIGFATSGDEIVRIGANGAMSIGTNTITDKLYVFNGTGGPTFTLGTGIRLGQSYNAVYSRISTNFGGSMGLYAGTGSANAELNMYTNDILRLRINSSGRQVYNGNAGATGHGNFVGEVGSSYRALAFERTVGGGVVGSVVTNASSTSYNTSSDYRLKENVSYDFDATTRLKQLKPARFNFIADADTTVDGFLAHEVSSIVPEAITGEKDAMKTEEYEVTPAVLDEDGNVITEAVMGTREVPDYQGIDQAKLVPLLVKTIQELEARITALENN
jgi:hypothetical protein